MSIVWSGDEELQKRLRAAPKKALSALAAALQVTAEVDVMTPSIDRFVPKDLGALANSGFVEEPRQRGNTVTVEMGYGGTAVPYALAVHEHPSRHSPPSWRGKRADEINWNVAGSGPKYLEKPAEELRPHFDRRLGIRVKRQKLL